MDEVDRLIQELNDPDDDVRIRAVSVLGRIKDPRSIGPLVSALNDCKEDVRLKAAKALENIGFEKISLKDKIRCLLILQRLEELMVISRDSIPPLIESLQDGDPEIRINAVLALNRISDKSATPALIGILDDEDNGIRAIALDALQGILRKLVYMPDIEQFEKAFRDKLPDIKKRLRIEGKRLSDSFFESWKRLIAEKKMQIASLLDKVTEDKGILLPDKPKPPKKGHLYRLPAKSAIRS